MRGILMGLFERYLSIWVSLAIAIGIGLGQIVPGAFEALARFGYANVNFAVALLIWAMVWPMMIGVDFSAMRRVGEKPKGLIITLVVNWLIKPFTMAALGVLFFRHVFAPFIPPGDAEGYIAGLILLGAAPCTAHVLRGRGPARDELHEHEILLPRLSEHFGVFLFRVARYDSAESHHLARAARTPSNRHLRVDELPISDRCFSLFNFCYLIR